MGTRAYARGTTTREELGAGAAAVLAHCERLPRQSVRYQGAQPIPLPGLPVHPVPISYLPREFMTLPGGESGELRARGKELRVPVASMLENLGNKSTETIWSVRQMLSGHPSPGMWHFSVASETRARDGLWPMKRNHK